MNRNPNTLCEICGRGFYRRPHQKEQGLAKYCSRSCYRTSVPVLIKVCPVCSKEFSPQKKDAKTCSRPCSNVSRRGITYTKTGARYQNKSQKRLVELQRMFNFTTCMIEGCNYSNCFEIHRLLPGKEGGEYKVGNMFAICPNHHAEITRGLIEVEYVNDYTLKIKEDN